MIYNEEEIRELVALTLGFAKQGQASLPLTPYTICAHLRYKGREPVVTIFCDQSANIDDGDEDEEPQEIHLTESEYYQAVMVFDRQLSIRDKIKKNPLQL